ncbi:cGMP-dependent protein kinase, isozyme 1 isoform X2 [Nilaparvata lugens]|uniref:cGMP-dependent protein kinase, isozyme 1 isoform X2 n=1 Tax=Nilaparvata lugens TaxID=108931 RepID=UPI00193CD452|nr:cGMP-dependent protein kinase, isozyme 1 isoform X2 [Nilaparvata lugens]
MADPPTNPPTNKQRCSCGKLPLDASIDSATAPPATADCEAPNSNITSDVGAASEASAHARKLSESVAGDEERFDASSKRASNASTGVSCTTGSKEQICRLQDVSAAPACAVNIWPVVSAHDPDPILSPPCDSFLYSGPVSLTEILQERDRHYVDWRCTKLSFDDSDRVRDFAVWAAQGKRSIDEYWGCGRSKIIVDHSVGGDRYRALNDNRRRIDQATLTEQPPSRHHHNTITSSRMRMGNGASSCDATRHAAGDKRHASSDSVRHAETARQTCASTLLDVSCTGGRGGVTSCANEAVIPLLQRELKEWETRAMQLGTELLQLRRELEARDHEIVRLHREVHKLRSVLQQTTTLVQDGDLLSSLQQVHGMVGQNASNKKQGVSAESSRNNQTATDIQVQHFEKDFSSKQLIKAAILDNDFLKNLSLSQVRELVESMHPQECTKGNYVIREGESGAHLYVAAEGEFEVIKDGKVLGHMGPGKAFGELAILYNCTRTASVRAVKDSKVWVLDRRIFQRIMKRTGLQRLEENISFLRSVPLLHNLSSDMLARIADCLEVEFFPSGHHIIRQGASGDTFFILSGGSVKVTQKIPGTTEDQEIRILERGDYFGEQALLKEEFRTASVIALSPGVECLTLDRESFIRLIGDLSELHQRDYGDKTRSVVSRPPSASSVHQDSDQEMDFISLNDLDIIETLGIGGFGRVELVQCVFDKNQTFALKCLKKQHIVETHQQEHVYSEKSIMMECRSAFICRLYKTFKDNKYVYMLLEACMGGEVWTILRDRGYFDDATACFITACVVEALDYLHSRGIVYRDLKPENLLLDSTGYVKIVDFGFAKKLGYSSKTWTFCGTPEYVAPEIILNKGHDKAVDCWALGILMHELLTGAPPFSGTDPMKVYNMILKGINMVLFPRHMTRAAQCLIKRLCKDAPAERLGAQKGGINDIRKNKWFQGFDWDGLRNRTLVPPIVPQIHSPTDTSNFDNYPKEADIPPDEDSHWDVDF